MFFNRLILFILIIASGIFASNFGGNVSYALFYMSLCIPVISLIYTYYVYIRFRIYQDIGQRVLVKGDLIPYSFTIANEDYITFRSVKVNFLHDKSTIWNAEELRKYCLLPGQTEKMETKLRCNYRGEYYVGANTVEIIDYLYLFRITYPIASKLKVTVLPRIVSIPRLGIAPVKKDVKISSYVRNAEQDTMDIDTRKYQTGDSIKQIHWKLSAKKNQLFSRSYSTNPKSEVIILMDLRQIQEDNLTTVIVEDQIIESVLAIANYCKDNKTDARVYYEQSGLKTEVIRGKTDFDLFYKRCVEIHFNSQVPIEEILGESKNYGAENSFYVLITHNLNFELYKSMLEVSENGSELSLLLIRDKVNSDEEEIVKSMKLAGITVKLVTREDDIGEVLNA
ncbi:DUF58 domain-containing protein [Anaerocolumna sp. MB42-C2]|uniref:DUF58 domain-containing protein n=1 Tax=Anaerocolumna sp. MB42-C2 TaxID=3070997 RepID=UPI0027E185B9|nr:DUF58 domain-containing protein [Anaerocolumna sp. MB42-C2]WMJ85270.1 DUF58 domain-containing protein [Anaerocolumna sp. MB42-C2]